ncbi:DNA cytosine methyltransferase [Parendozoicomonas haliclonae]|uniref:DNA (cytosine-5-)-methyltransferase n=2 Tax=Parendozoicomonas haliclonae TaxID=1960125 RepID=A0A1X7AHJ7_9GAMM|nr:Modification methylase AplI [Parendozoicomonas haliclonae]
MHQSIPFVDIFAGPGGLSEGFSAYRQCDGSELRHPFYSILSAEKEESAFCTLRLRAFLRYFIYRKNETAPKVYIDYVSDRTREAKNTPALLLSELIHSRDISPASCIAELRISFVNEFKEQWEVFASTYKEHLDDILTAIFHARHDVKHFELGGDDVPDKKGNISPYIERALAEVCTNNADYHEFILVGGPPCQAYSNAGRSRRSAQDLKNYMCGDTGKYVFDKDPRATLYKEYLKVLAENEPAIFVMENVRGMLSAQFTNADGTKEQVWKRVVSELHHPSKALGGIPSFKSTKYVVTSLVSGKTCFYSGEESQLSNINPNDFLVRASDFGVPQHRDRVILLGIRADLLDGHSIDEVLTTVKLPEIFAHNVSVEQAIGDLPAQFSTLSSVSTDFAKRKSIPTSKAETEWKKAICIQIKDIAREIDKYLPKNINIKSFDEWKDEVNSTGKKLYFSEILENKKSDNTITINALFKFRIKQILEQTGIKIDELTKGADSKFNIGSKYNWPVDHECPESLLSWYKYKSAGLPILNHYPRGHMDTDIARYVYSSCYAVAYRELEEALKADIPDRVLSKIGTVKDFLKKEHSIYDRVSLDDLKEVSLAPDHKNTQSFVDRFKVQRAESPATTVTCHLSKDGHYYIHPDPVQCRSLTVREAARLQTFPDNYFFEGKPTQQRTQVGNAVPPLLATHISSVIYELWKTFFAPPT